MTGTKTYFDMINDAGGVGGRKLKLIAYDDSYDPAMPYGFCLKVPVR